MRNTRKLPTYDEPAKSYSIDIYDVACDGNIYWFRKGKRRKQNPVDVGPDFESIADAVVIFRASEDMDLHIPSEYERTLQGRILSFEKAQPGEGAIKHTPRTIIAPISKDGIYRLYLTKFPERDDYYIFARIDLNKK